MHVVFSQITVADYCTGLTSGDIIVNRQYQRSDRVWPDAARAFLIETIIAGLPIPKLSLHQVTDVKSRKTIKEIVDGQQRSEAILAFAADELRISPRSKIEGTAGRTYSQLPEELKGRFLAYGLPVDLFVAATPDEIRDVFRRINSYTVPLNPEEQRHAGYQGPFKWFINDLSEQYAPLFESLGAFSGKQLVRMADAKLLTEVTHAMMYGITTTNRHSLDKLYEQYDHEFPHEGDYRARFDAALAEVAEMQPLHRGPLMRPYNMYSLLLALTHIVDPLGTLQEVFDQPSPVALDSHKSVQALSVLADALEDPESHPEVAEFLAACEKQTNTGSQRRIRFQWFCGALAH